MSDALTFATVSTKPPEVARAKLAQFAASVASLVGQPVAGAVASSYAALVDELAAGRVQFAWMPPALLVLAEERVPIEPLVSALRGDRLNYRSVLFVDAAASIHTVDDLRGRTVAWVDPSSAAGYLYPRLQLASRGIDPATLFKREVFLGSHQNVARAVFDGTAHVGATFADWAGEGLPVRRAGFLDAAPGREARIIEWTGPIPNDLVVGHGNVPRDLRQKFARSMLAMTTVAPGRQVLEELFDAKEFLWSADEALAHLRQLVKLARTHGLLPALEATTAGRRPRP